jgi:hypothetical protein
LNKIKNGESVKVIASYDLFGLELTGEKGIVVSFSESNQKYLVYFEKNGEYAELDSSFLKRTSPGKISKKNKQFLSNIKRMVCTY